MSACVLAIKAIAFDLQASSFAVNESHLSGLGFNDAWHASSKAGTLPSKHFLPDPLSDTLNPAFLHRSGPSRASSLKRLHTSEVSLQGTSSFERE